MRDTMLQLLTTLAGQGKVDPYQGTAQAMVGAQQRIADPHLYDMVFPLIALLLVIIVPAVVASWVAWKTITDTTLEDGEA
jgi:hypothetical protein